MWPILLFILCFLFWFLQKLTNRKRGLPPGPFRFPGIGCMIQLLMADKDNQSNGWLKLSKYYGNVFYIQIGGVKGVVINGYETLCEVFQTDEWVERKYGKWLFDRTFGIPASLMTGHLYIWRQSKRFGAQKLRDFKFSDKQTMEAVILEELEELVVLISNRISKNGGVVYIPHLFDKPVLNTTWPLIFESRFEYNDPKATKIISLVTNSFKSMSIEYNILMASPFLMHYAPLFTVFTDQEVTNREMDKYFRNIIADIRTHSEYKTNPTNFVQAFVKKIDSSRPNVSVDGVTYSDKNLISILGDFTFGAFQFSSNTLAFAIMYLVLNMRVQENVIEEIDAVLGANKRPTLADREKLPYTEATILEIHRIININKFGIRNIDQDTRVGNYLIPKGTTVFLNNYSATMDPGVWGDPHIFRPERFLTCDGKKFNANQFFTFSARSQNCIGSSVAEATMFLFFTGLLQRFKFMMNPFEPRPSTKVVSGKALSPRPFSVIITPRH